MSRLTSGIIFGMVAGIVIGLFPLVMGTRREKTSLGIAGLFACALSGAMLGMILAIPVGSIFVWLITRKSKAVSAS